MANSTESAAETVAEAAGHAAEKAGMPQLDFATFPNQIFWLAVALVVIYLVLSRVALPRIGAILADRQGTITNDLAAAEDLKARALAAEKAYEQALVDARAEAQKIIAEARAVIQAEVDVATAHADAEIAARAAESERRIGEIRASAVDSVREVARDTAAALVAALGGNVDAKAIATAVTARLKG
jgi:F-type H+-transporting ATPase subunit b